MSEPLVSYPNLGPEHLEILPNLSNKIAYQDVPTTIPPLSPDQKASFLDAILFLMRLWMKRSSISRFWKTKMLLEPSKESHHSSLGRNGTSTPG